jgi:phosphoglycerate dehydrogenase-like enzyme
MSIVITEDLGWPMPHWLTGKYEVVYNRELYKDVPQFRELAKRAQALVIRNKTRIDDDLLTTLPHLRTIGRLGVGLDNIDLRACRAHNVTVIAARGCNANSVAEYVIAGVFDHARFLRRCDAQIREGIWDRFAATGREISGKTIGLVGVGDIGQRVAMRARALGMKVLAYDPFLLPSNVLIQDFDVTLTHLEVVCRRSDYISVHVPLTPVTHHLISESEMKWMKDGVVLINTSRGGIIDEAALLQNLRTYPKRSAILDVRESEPPDRDDPLSAVPNILMTPHVAGITYESSQRVAEFILGQVDNALSGHEVQGKVI